MFSRGGGLAVPTVSIDPEREREPPLPPTPVQFPNYHTSIALETSSESKLSPNTLYHLLSRVKSPQDISDSFLKALNVTIIPDVEISDLLPQDALKAYPPFQSNGDKSPTQEGTGTRLGNGYRAPDQQKYNVLKEELSFDNTNAFRSLARLKPLPGHEEIKITHARKLWVGLDHLAQYWDCSLDQFIERTSDTVYENGETSVQMDIDKELATSPDVRKPASGPPKPENSTKYKGRRIGTGREMPEYVREDVLRGFLEMIAWSFGCQIKSPTKPPRLSVKGLLFPVRHNFVIARIPEDRGEARKNILEGPVLFAQCRGETAFRDESGNPLNGHVDICDILREVAGMLLLAQERAREKETEVKPGQGKWWAAKPRWGGALDNDVPPSYPSTAAEATGKKFDGKVDADLSTDQRSRHKRKQPLVSRRTGLTVTRMTKVEKWRIVQPGPGLWDPKMKYMRIGAGTDSSFDDIFMISSLNHHFSIVHIRVHSNYLEWLSTGRTEFPDDDTDTSEQPWHRLVVRRTRWFDFLNVKDRVDGFDGLWALFTWLLR
ncbi:hypothetical protein FQN57_002795 [Myotisia sp. PD_48]|nr:hypothetical protein FQN57_002795 [Myotisia sp. PD_48]